MALLPTLGPHILQGMDVEGVTQELQSFSSKAPKARVELQHPTAPSESSATSSVDVGVRIQEADGRSDNGSVSVASDAVPTEMSASSTSWVDQFSSMGSSQVSAVSPAPVGGGTSDSSRSSMAADLSDSMLTTSSASSSSAPGPSVPSVSPLNLPEDPLTSYP